MIQTLHSRAHHSAVVSSIEEFADRYHVPKPFIGLILIPIVVSTAGQSCADAS